MTRILWDQVGKRRFKTGVDRGVFYKRNPDGSYGNAVPWNGLTNVTESPSGAEANKTYADNMVYVVIKSAEEFGGTIEALFYPDEFAECDGSAEVVPGVKIGQQNRKSFGFAYRTLLGNDTESTDYGYEIHVIYGADAAPSEVANGTVNESPEPGALSWELTTTPTPVGTINGVEYKPTAHLTIDSTKLDAATLALVEDLLYGDNDSDGTLPTPAELIALIEGESTPINLATYANQPSYNNTTHVATLPAVTGVVWYVDGEETAAGALPALAVGETIEVEARAASGYHIAQGDTDWTYSY